MTLWFDSLHTTKFCRFQVTVTNTTINFNKPVTSSPLLSSSTVTTATSNSYTQSLSSTPVASLSHRSTPVQLKFSPKLDKSYSPVKTSTSGSNASLPKPEQWLGQIVSSATPHTGKHH